MPDSGLKEYRSRRDFASTPEPQGGAATRSGRAYSIQKHDATRLHYDLRLEHDGVLLSWAVTRGPSPAPAEKRLAVRTEDHPLDYRTFEGVIPEGYGKGTVMLWDQGEWEPLHDVGKGLREGKLHFRLHGARLRGGWVLVRMRGREKRENWLLIKEDDDLASDEPEALTERFTTSVATGRAFDAIASGKAAERPSRGKRPAFRAPMLAETDSEVPEGGSWWFEPKLDGYRCQVALGKGGAVCYSRSGHDWTDRFTGVADAAEALSCRSALIDGEVVAERDESFSGLQRAMQEVRPLVFYAFDLLERDGRDLAGKPFSARREALSALLDPLPPRGTIRLSPLIEGHGPALLEAVCGSGGEGVVAKRADAGWSSGRSRRWLKVKCIRRAEFVVGGWSPSDKVGRPFSSLLLGAWEGDRLIYRGRVGGGFDQAAFDLLAPLLRGVARKAAPFDEVPREIARGARWVSPELVVEVRYAEITHDGHVRHATFEGLREDKPAREVAAPSPREGEVTPPSERHVDGIRISNADRVMFPGTKLTKGGLADYYEAVGEHLLEHARDRPASLIRCPEGIDGECFFQKHGHRGFADAVPRWTHEGEEWLYLNAPRALVAATQMGTVEFHVQGVRRDRPDRPDRMVFDLDPDEGLGVDEVRAAARELRALLGDLDLPAGLMTTGGKGVHVVVPLRRTAAREDVSNFAQAVAQVLTARAPDRFTANQRKDRRKGRVFIDWQRNGRQATAVSPWSVRARPGAPVAMPLDWDELDTTAPDAFDVESALIRLDRVDPLAAVPSGSLSRATVEALERLSDGG